MVWAQHALEADVAVGTHAGQHIGFTCVVPGFLKSLRCAAHIAKMHKKDLVAKVADHAGQVVGHERKVALTERDAVHGAWNEIEQALEVLDAAHNTPHATDRRKG